MVDLRDCAKFICLTKYFLLPKTIFRYVYKVGPYDRYKWSYNPSKWPSEWTNWSSNPQMET